MVYTGDTGWNDSLTGFAEGCDLLLCEASLFNKFKGRVEGHLTAGEAGLIAEKAAVKQLVLCHFPHYGIIADLIREAEEVYSGKVEPAEPGSVYDLPGN
jgi:ribonuclease BN (tRNA processing enzyme)